MVSRCNAVGVRIYVDAVINHMAAGGNIEFILTKKSKYSIFILYIWIKVTEPVLVLLSTQAQNRSLPYHMAQMILTMPNAELVQAT
jgi:hypothetical protein